MTPTTPAKAATTPAKAKRVVNNRGLLARASTHFTKHPGDHIDLRDLTAELGAGEAQVKACMADIISRNKLPGLEPVVKGNVWVYRPNGKPAKRTFEEVGQAKGGVLVLQDEEGKLWAAKPLEVS